MDSPRPRPFPAGTAAEGEVRPRWERVPRNRPCPCGSGRKYKRCCLERDRARGGPPDRSPVSASPSPDPSPPAPPSRRGPVRPSEDPSPEARELLPGEGLTDLPRELTLEGTTLRLLVQVKRVKNINYRLRGDDLAISVPLDMDPGYLRNSIVQCARKLLRRQTRRAAPRTDAELDAVVREVAARFPRPPAVAGAEYSTDSTVCWGRYFPATAGVQIHSAVRHMPRWVLRAVVAHELAHSVHLHHTAEFWDLVNRVCPETARAREFLAGVTWLAGAVGRVPAAELDPVFPRRS